MTKFEKWKKELTVKRANDIFSGYSCYCCPAYGECEDSHYCEESFMEWANLPAESADTSTN